MASFGGSRFPRPMFNQNFPRNNFIMNPSGNRQNMQPFQRPPNPAFRPFQPPERFMHGNFQNRPPFSNFPDPLGPPAVRNRLPPPNQVFPGNPPPNFLRPRGSFERPFRPWNQIPPSFAGPRPHLHNRPRAPVPSQPQGNFPFHPNKKPKLKTRGFRKLKDDTTVKPYSCDTCDRAFVTENELHDHISQHIKCDHAACTFEAHPKIVALHKKMQHETGYADRINKLKDDAEIQKWREERKRRFPTAENIKKRKAEQAEKEARGEILETKEFGKFKRRRDNDGNAVRHDTRKRGRSFKNNERRRNFHPRSQPFTIDVESESDSDSDSHIKLHRFSGMSSLANSAIEITDEIEDIEAKSGSQTNVIPVSNKYELPSPSLHKQNLPKSEFDCRVSNQNVQCAETDASNLDKDQSTLVFNDNSCNDVNTAPNSIMNVPVGESTAEKENVKDVVNQSICEIPLDECTSEKQKNVELVKVEDSDDESPIAVPIVKSIEKPLLNDPSTVKYKDVEEILSPSTNTSTKPPVSNSENGFCRNNSKSRQHPRHHRNNMSNQSNAPNPEQVVRKSSLLEKLLADDIRHERNVILQCIRHIVKSNFFEIKVEMS